MGGTRVPVISLLGAEIVAFHRYCDKNPKESKYRWYTEESEHSRLGPSSTLSYKRDVLCSLDFFQHSFFICPWPDSPSLTPKSLLLVLQHPALGQCPGQMNQTQLALTESQVLKETQRKLQWCDCRQYAHSPSS